MFSMAFAKLLISCAQELQSTSEMQTYTSKVESQYIKSPMNLVIVCKSFPEVAYVHLVFQFLAQTTKTTRSRPIPNWNRGLLMKPNQQWFRTKNRGYSENQIEPNIKKPLCHTWRVVPVWWQRCYLCYLYIQMLLVLCVQCVHTDVTCVICTYRGGGVSAVEWSAYGQTNRRCCDPSAAQDVLWDHQRETVEWHRAGSSKGRQEQRRMFWIRTFCGIMNLIL